MTSFTISELATEFDITARTIRFYEDQGLLSRSEQDRQATGGSTRSVTVPACASPLRGKRLGLTLAQLRNLLDMYETEADTRQQLEAFLKALGEHKQTLHQQLEDINLSLAEIEAQEKRVIKLLSRASDA